MSTTWRTAHSNLIHVTDLELSNSTFKKVRHFFINKSVIESSKLAVYFKSTIGYFLEVL